MRQRIHPNAAVACNCQPSSRPSSPSLTAPRSTPSRELRCACKRVLISDCISLQVRQLPQPVVAALSNQQVPNSSRRPLSPRSRPRWMVRRSGPWISVILSNSLWPGGRLARAAGCLLGPKSGCLLGWDEIGPNHPFLSVRIQVPLRPCLTVALLP
jgi:hypothetical protein